MPMSFIETGDFPGELCRTSGPGDSAQGKCFYASRRKQTSSPCWYSGAGLRRRFKLMWPGLRIEDIYTGSGTGLITFTAVALAAFSVQDVPTPTT